jgi:hypothetical protein
VERVDAGINPGGVEELIYTKPENVLQAKFIQKISLEDPLT